METAITRLLRLIIRQRANNQRANNKPDQIEPIDHPPLDKDEATINYMDLDEFADLGFLQEANRLFFHPLGLAIEVSDVDHDKHFDTIKIWDYRHDPEGITFGPGVIDYQKVNHVRLERDRHWAARQKLLGSPTQII